jgi:hypothetical protein
MQSFRTVRNQKISVDGAWWSSGRVEEDEIDRVKLSRTFQVA